MKRIGLLLTVVLLLLVGLWIWQERTGGEGLGAGDSNVDQTGSIQGEKADTENPVAKHGGRSERSGTVDRARLGTGGLGRVQGVVVNPLWEGVEGARITLLRRQDIDRLGASAPVIQSTRTGMRGEFSLGDVEMGAYIVRVRAEGFARGWGELRLTRASPISRRIRVVLTRGHVLEGVVVDGQGQGVEGAWVIVSGLRGVGHGTEVRSGPDGRFVVPALPRGRAQVLAWAEGRGLGVGEGAVGAEAPLRVQLPVDSRYRISMSLAAPREDGLTRPTDVTVQILYSFGNRLISLPSPIRHYSIPDKGQVQTPPLCEGRFSVRARSTQVVMTRPWNNADLGRQVPEVSIDLLWQEGKSLRGQLAFADRRPAADVLVQASSRDSMEQYTAQSDSQGRFVFANKLWTTKSVMVRLVSKGYLFVVDGKKQRWSLIAGGTAENLLTVMSTPVWRGRVIDDKGRPAVAAKVWLEATEGKTWRIANASTDREGRFEIALEQDFGKPLFLGARNDHGYCPDPPIVNAGGRDPTENIQLRLVPTATLEGRVLDGRGMGLAEVGVTAYFSISDTGDPVAIRRARKAGRWETRRTRSDDDGRFRIPSLPPGAWRIVARARGRSKAAKDPIVVLSRGEARKGLKLVLRKGLSIEGRIVNEVGEPIPMVSIRGKFEGKLPPGSVEGQSAATTALDGRFELSGLHAGPYLLTAHPTSGVQRKLGLFEPGPDGHLSMRYNRPFRMRAMAGAKNLRWRIERVRLGGIRARLVHQGAAIQQIRVELRSSKPMGVWEYDMPVESGQLSIPRVVSGTYTVKIGGTRFEAVTRTVHVEPEEIADLGLLTLAEFPRVAGRVQDPTGRPLAGVWLGLDPKLADLWPSYDPAKGRESFAGRVIAQSDAQGRFRLPLPRSTRIFAFKPGYAPTQRAVSVPKGSKSASSDPEPLVLQMRPAAELGIRAPAPQIGKPATWGARLTPIRPGSSPAPRQGRPAGARYLWLKAGKVSRFVGLPPGRYRLEALNFNKSTVFRAESIPGRSYHEEIDLQIGTKHVIRIP